MNRFFGLGLFLLLASSAALALPQAAPSASPTPPAPQNGTPSAAAPQSPPDYAQEPFVIEKYYSTARFENDGTGERDLNVRIRVQSEAGLQALGELVFGYSDANEKMDVRSVVRAQSRRHQCGRRSGRGKRNDGADCTRCPRLYRLQGKAHHGAFSATRRHSGVLDRDKNRKGIRSQPVLVRA